MRIALLLPQDSPNISWNVGRGIEHTLKRMGHEVLAIPMPTLRPATDSPQEHKRIRMLLEETKKNLPKISDIAACDAVIVSGPEHIGPWIEEVYERYDWRNLEIPTAAWMHESCERDDYQIDFEAIKWIAKDWFFPAIQDAEKHDQEMFAKDHSHYLPFGVDENVFSAPMSALHEHDIFEVAFIGLLYPKRVAFLQALSRHNHPPIRLGNVMVQDLHGYDNEGSVHKYAENLRQIKVFFNLPALSRLTVTKVYEVLACGGFLLTPMLSPEGGVSVNMKIFEPGVHLVSYRSSNLGYVAQLLNEWSSEEKRFDRIRIAAEGCKLVHEKHTLTHRMTEMFEKMGVAAQVKEAVN